MFFINFSAVVAVCFLVQVTALPTPFNRYYRITTTPKAIATNAPTTRPTTTITTLSTTPPISTTTTPPTSTSATSKQDDQASEPAAGNIRTYDLNAKAKSEAEATTETPKPDCRDDPNCLAAGVVKTANFVLKKTSDTTFNTADTILDSLTEFKTAEIVGKKDVDQRNKEFQVAQIGVGIVDKALVGVYEMLSRLDLDKK